LPLDASRLKAYAVKTILRKLNWKTDTAFRAGCIEADAGIRNAECGIGIYKKNKRRTSNIDGLVKSQISSCPDFVMPDLIRHPEHTEITGFRLSPE
jgi:hypothetical protein